MTALADLPGYRRRITITPGDGIVRAELEDDYHQMAVALMHKDGIATDLTPIMTRAPWTTCPGAIAKLKQTFTGVALNAFPERGDKTFNCTHLYDLALWAAAHANADARVVYDVIASDVQSDGTRSSEVLRDGEKLLEMTLRGYECIAPAEITGRNLFDLRAWIDAMPANLQEAARILRWGTMIAGGRSIPMEKQSDASRMPPNCFTFQPAAAAQAKRLGQIKDFTGGDAGPLAQPIFAKT